MKLLVVLLPSTVNGTDLGAQEWIDSLFLRYCINPPGLPYYYDGCSAAFDICHSLKYKTRDLIPAYHNNLSYGVADLVRKAFTPRHVRDDPKIYIGCALHGVKDKIKGSPSKDKE